MNDYDKKSQEQLRLLRLKENDIAINDQKREAEAYE